MKLANCQRVRITGDISQIKSIEFSNVLMLDFILLVPQSLKAIGESFQTVTRKLDFDIADVTRENW